MSADNVNAVPRRSVTEVGDEELSTAAESALERIVLYTRTHGYTELPSGASEAEWKAAVGELGDAGYQIREAIVARPDRAANSLGWSVALDETGSPLRDQPDEEMRPFELTDAGSGGRDMFD